MPDAFTLANARITLALNHSLNANPALFKFAFFMTEQGTKLLVLLTILILWFCHERHGDEAGAAQSRIENRARILTFSLAIVLAYLAVRLVALRLDVERPFATFLPISGPPGIFNGLRSYGSFPSEYAVLLGALPAAFFGWKNWLGWCWAIPAVALAVMRVAVGMNYPLDMAAGALLGAVVVTYVLRRQAQEGTFRELTKSLASGFDSKNSIYQYSLYVLALLLMLEFSMNFRHVAGVMRTVGS